MSLKLNTKAIFYLKADSILIIGGKKYNEQYDANKKTFSKSL